MDLEDPASVCWRGGDSRTWPERAWRRRAITVLMVAGLLASMALNAVVGWPDASGALTFAQRMSGVLFVLSGLVLGAAAIAAFDYQGRRQFRFSGAIVLLGVLITLATDSLLLFMWFEEMEYTHYALVFMSLWCWSVWMLWLLVRGKAWQGVPGPKRFAAGVVATALLTGVSLAYSTMYQPAAAPMHFILKAEFGKPRADRTLPFIHVPVTLYMRNTGEIPVYIINDIFTIRGRNAQYSDRPERGDFVREWKESAEVWGDPGNAERHVRKIRYTKLSSGHFYGPGSRLETGQEYTLQHVFQLPKDPSYDTISVDLQVSYMRKDRGKLDVETFGTPHYSWSEGEGRYYCPPERGCSPRLVYHGRLRHNNNLVNVTRKTRYVTAIWYPGDDDPISSISSFDYGLESGFEREERRELDRYGATKVRANSAVPVAELLTSSGA
ncbi:Yip1 family protein [Streptomyces sp. NBC_00443]|uniref:Yip1 family protein n=1 Tax=Streptomyces sp. NBC_00443 TaxID=2975743 RepID=UPI002E1F9361